MFKDTKWLLLAVGTLEQLCVTSSMSFHWQGEMTLIPLVAGTATLHNATNGPNWNTLLLRFTTTWSGSISSGKLEICGTDWLTSLYSGNLTFQMKKRVAQKWTITWDVTPASGGFNSSSGKPEENAKMKVVSRNLLLLLFFQSKNSSMSRSSHYGFLRCHRPRTFATRSHPWERLSPLSFHSTRSPHWCRDYRRPWSQ